MFSCFVKNEVKSSFGKGENDDAQFLMNILDKNNLNYENRRHVHPSSLKGFVKEQVEKGKAGEGENSPES